MNWDGLNRRRFPRVNYPCLVVIHNQEKVNDVILTHTENIGVGGICVILKQDVAMFSPVNLEIDLLDLGEHIKCPGRVVWNVQRRSDAKTKPLFYDIGVEFVDLPEAEKERVEDVVKRLIHQQDNQF
ncbi:MAG: PilZ domain-containing protein [Candidatus Omnitrophica bacterium]|nr:PilZ domain-containing protein [Candidatus Omnitrophota bacterium]